MTFLRSMLIAALCQHARRRDVKGLIQESSGWRDSLLLQVFQVTFEAPVKPDIVVKTDEQTPDESIDYLFKQLKSKL